MTTLIKRANEQYLHCTVCYFVRVHKYLFSLSLELSEPEKTIDISRRHSWFQRFSREMTFENRAQKFHTDDASPQIWVVLMTDWKFASTNRLFSQARNICNHSNESYWTVLSRGTIYCAGQGGSNFEFLDAVLVCDHSDKSHWAALSCGTVYYAVQGGSIFWVCGWNPKVGPFTSNLLCRTSLSWLSHCSYEWLYSRTS